MQRVRKRLPQPASPTISVTRFSVIFSTILERIGVTGRFEGENGNEVESEELVDDDAIFRNLQVFLSLSLCFCFALYLCLTKRPERED